MSKNAELAETVLRRSAEVRDLTPESCYLRWRGPSCDVIRFALPDLKTQSVPRSKQSLSVIQTSQIILYREIIAVCSQIHTMHCVGRT